jgi:tetratricopeptide (TPR) repeat protein
MFEQAIAIDDQFALGYAGLANYYAVAAARNQLRPFETHFARAIELSHRVIALDPTFAIPYLHFGVKAMYLESDWDAAGREFRRGVALDPTYAEGQRFLGTYFAAMGRFDEALVHLREAVRLEPRLPLYRNALADACMLIEAYPEAIEQLSHALAIDPGYGAARERLIRCYERSDRLQEAVTTRALAPQGSTAQRLASTFAQAFGTDGEAGYRRARADELRAMIHDIEACICLGPLEDASEILNPPQLRLALAYAELGEWGRALAWEDQACKAQPGRRQWFIHQPMLRPLQPLRRARPAVPAAASPEEHPS